MPIWHARVPPVAHSCTKDRNLAALGSRLLHDQLCELRARFATAFCTRRRDHQRRSGPVAEVSRLLVDDALGERLAAVVVHAGAWNSQLG